MLMTHQQLLVPVGGILVLPATWRQREHRGPPAEEARGSCMSEGHKPTEGPSSIF